MVGKTPEVVPAGQTVILEAMANVSSAHSGKYVILEQPSASSLPSGLLVTASLVSLPTKQPCHLPVVLKNETEHYITIPSKTILADVNAVVRVLHKEQTVKEPSPPDTQKESPQTTELSFDFGDSPLPPSVVSEKGVKTDPEKVKALTTWPVPITDGLFRGIPMSSSP